MESRVPLPTDSIYKFCALFGLLTVIFSLGSLIYLTKSTNDLVFESSVELASLQAIEERSPGEEQKMKMLERKLEIATEDKSSLSFGCQILMVLGSLMLAYGFGKWHRVVQPVQDELAELTVEKLRLEVEQQKKQMNDPGMPDSGAE